MSHDTEEQDWRQSAEVTARNLVHWAAPTVTREQRNRTVHAYLTSHSREELSWLTWHDPLDEPAGTSEFLPGFLDDVAHHPDTPIEVVTEMAHHPDWSVRFAAATSPHCPTDLLITLAEDPDVAGAVAKNTHTPVEVIRRLAGSDSPWVRRAAAGNPHCPEDLLRLLAADEDCTVMAGAAANPATPLDVLEHLAHLTDYPPFVWEALHSNPALPEDLQVVVALHDPDGWLSP